MKTTNIKTILKNIIREVIEEQTDDTFVQTIKLGNKQLSLHKITKDPFKPLYYLETMDGESYLDMNTILPDNLLLDAIWIKQGGKEEKIADQLRFLTKTTKTTKSGFNTYIMYNTK